MSSIFFFFNDTATTEIYTLSLHDALPIYPRLHRRRAHEPRAAGVVDERRVTAPAEGIAVRVGPGLDPPPLVLEALDDQAVRLLVGDQPAVDLFPARALERAVGRDGGHERKAVLLPHRVVVGAEGRGHVHEPRPLLGRDEPARDHDGPLAFVRQRHDLERADVLLAHAG